MTLEDVRKAMIAELDLEAVMYEYCKDVREKKVIATEYTIKARAYKQLIKKLFGFDAFLDNLFPTLIDDYIDYRKAIKK